MKKEKKQPVLLKRIFLSLFVVLFSCVTTLSCMPAYAVENDNNSSEQSSEKTEDKEEEEKNDTTEVEEIEEDCDDQAFGLSWIVCSAMMAVSKATDSLYGATQEILDIAPISTEDTSAIHIVWEYMRNLSNIVFIILLIIVIYSQLTGLGISNYGIKRILPRLIIVILLINLSFIICQLAIDLSNILGFGLREFFESVQTTVVANGAVAGEAASAEPTWSQVALVLTGGTVTVGAVAAFAGGFGALFWPILVTLLGAVAAVIIGLVTVVMRQAVVALLVMIAPMAFVCFLLPNTEKWFTKWKNLLFQMLIFYPMYSVLFGASKLAGWAIIMSATSAFWVVVGLAVQVFPLFFSWSLMKMSGTMLGAINQKLNAATAKPLGMFGDYAQKRQMLSRARYLGGQRPKTLSQDVMQRIEDRQNDMDIRTKKYMDQTKLRGMAYSMGRYRDKDGTVSKLGEEYYAMQADMMGYQKQIEKSKNDFNKGFGVLKDGSKNKAQTIRLRALDLQNVLEADTLKYELARGAKIEADNTIGFHDRTQKAIDAHYDELNKNEKQYQQHSTTAVDRARYNTMLSTMDEDIKGVHYIGADAAYSANAQRRIVGAKFIDYFDSTVPTQDVVYRLSEFTSAKNVSENIDPVISGFRILNKRGDTDLIRAGMLDTLIDQKTGEKKIDLGTYASQALASFLMFDVKDNDPTLRRFGKYINLETARMYNYDDPTKRRRNSKITYDEYINGEYEEYDIDADGNWIIEGHDSNGKPRYKTSTRAPKRDAAVLLEGTTFKGMGRTTIPNLIESIRDASYVTNDDGSRHFDFNKFQTTQEKIWSAIIPNIIGDQFSFLSGSEEIRALAKGITGMNADHTFDWKGIFGKDIASTLTDDQKKEYMQLLNRRTKKFFGGHVPNQLARTKTDMLNAIFDLYLATSAVEDGDDSILNQDKFDKDEAAGIDEYKELQGKYGDEADRKLIDSVPHRYMEGYIKMKNKGLQGDAKAGLDERLHVDDLANYHKWLQEKIDKENVERAKNNKKARAMADEELTDEDDDSGPAPSFDDEGIRSTGATVHESEVTLIYTNYDSVGGNPAEFYGKICTYLRDNHLDATLQDFTDFYNKNKNASVTELYLYVIRLL